MMGLSGRDANTIHCQPSPARSPGHADPIKGVEPIIHYHYFKKCGSTPFVSIPVPAFTNMSDDPSAELEALRGRLHAWRDSVSDSKYLDAVTQRSLEVLDTDSTSFEWAPYTLVYDSPDKGFKDKAGEIDSITTPLPARPKA